MKDANFLKVGPARDIVGEFSKAVKNANTMHLGLYHSLFEWFNPLFAMDSQNGFTTRNYIKVGKYKILYWFILNTTYLKNIHYLKISGH